MKDTTVARRLNKAQLLLLILILSAVGLALWLENSRSNAEMRGILIERRFDRIRLDLSQMASQLRGQLLDPRGDADPKSTTVLDQPVQDLEASASELHREFSQHPALRDPLTKLVNYARVTLNPFRKTITDLQATDPAAAHALYREKFPALSAERDRWLKELQQQVEAVQRVEANEAQTISKIGVALVFVLSALTLLMGRYQSRAVARPLATLTAGLERLRHGDFSQRLQLPGGDEFGALATDLNRVADDLSKLVGQVQRSGIQVNTTATEIAATAREQQSTANQIAATTAQIGATSKEISATSKELDATMNEVSGVAAETAELANRGQSGIGRMEGTMRQIMEASGAVTAKLAVLSEKTANINTSVNGLSLSPASEN